MTIKQRLVGFLVNEQHKSNVDWKTVSLKDEGLSLLSAVFFVRMCQRLMVDNRTIPNVPLNLHFRCDDPFRAESLVESEILRHVASRRSNIKRFRN